MENNNFNNYVEKRAERKMALKVLKWFLVFIYVVTFYHWVIRYWDHYTPSIYIFQSPSNPGYTFYIDSSELEIGGSTDILESKTTGLHTTKHLSYYTDASGRKLPLPLRLMGEAHNSPRRKKKLTYHSYTVNLSTISDTSYDVQKADYAQMKKDYDITSDYQARDAFARNYNYGQYIDCYFQIEADKGVSLIIDRPLRYRNWVDLENTVSEIVSDKQVYPVFAKTLNPFNLDVFKWRVGSKIYWALVAGTIYTALVVVLAIVKKLREKCYW